MRPSGAPPPPIPAAFDAEFIELARSFYKTNNRRSALKKEIDLKLDSDLMEEKSYKSSRPGPAAAWRK
jgi:hypothetical protein